MNEALRSSMIVSDCNNVSLYVRLFLNNVYPAVRGVGISVIDGYRCLFDFQEKNMVQIERDQNMDCFRPHLR